MISSLKQQYNCEAFDLVDSAVLPERLYDLSTWLRQRNVDVAWSALARLDKRYGGEFFKRLSEGGCKVISWGLESASQTVLDLMQKGTDSSVFLRTLEGSHQAGIWNNLFVLLGFPGETESDVRLTRVFLDEAREFIDSVAYGPFCLEYGSPIFERPDEFGIRAKKVPQDYCEAVYEYTHNDKDVDSETAVAEFDKRFRYAHFARKNMRGVDGERLLTTLRSHGKDALRQLCIQRGQYWRSIDLALNEERPFVYSLEGLNVMGDVCYLESNKQSSYVLILNENTGSVAILDKKDFDRLRTDEGAMKRLKEFAAYELLAEYGLLECRFIPIIT